MRESRHVERAREGVRAGARVLIVDACRARSVGTRERLAELGLRTGAATSAGAALSALIGARDAGDPFDMVLVDPGLHQARELYEAVAEGDRARARVGFLPPSPRPRPSFIAHMPTLAPPRAARDEARA